MSALPPRKERKWQDDPCADQSRNYPWVRKFRPAHLKRPIDPLCVARVQGGRLDLLPPGLAGKDPLSLEGALETQHPALGGASVSEAC